MNLSAEYFICSKCHKEIPVNKQMGTHNRNHCPFCLWSKHVDLKVAGDRESSCHNLMKPIGLTFKHEGDDKQGELMLIHQCLDCSKVSINRLAADDDEKNILEVFENSLNLEQDLLTQLNHEHIQILNENNRQEINTQLFGLYSARIIILDE